MPCRDDAHYEYAVLKKRLDEVTQNLCFVCGCIENIEEAKSLLTHGRILKWWQEHQENDTIRIAAAMKNYVKDNPSKSGYEVADKFIIDAKKVHPVSEFHINWFYSIAGQQVSLSRAAKRSSGFYDCFH